MNLVVEPGQMVAIVGGTGAGKTTLVNLIERFYEVNIGEIIFDDKVEIHDLTRACLRENIAMVLQDTWVYKGTIGDNLKYGLKREITEEEFRNACRETFVDQFVSTLPDGYQTVISNEMSSLSAGEKQLLTICRAFLVKPNILILDEATSSVDTRTEAMIDQALDKLRGGTDKLCHCPPSVHNSQCRRNPGYGERAYRGAGQPQRAISTKRSLCQIISGTV